MLARELREKGCHLVIALTHMRTANDIRLAESVADVDIILGGHDHVYEKKMVSLALLFEKPPRKTINDFYSEDSFDFSTRFLMMRPFRKLFLCGRVVLDGLWRPFGSPGKTDLRGRLKSLSRTSSFLRAHKSRPSCFFACPIGQGLKINFDTERKRNTLSIWPPRTIWKCQQYVILKKLIFLGNNFYTFLYFWNVLLPFSIWKIFFFSD